MNYPLGVSPSKGNREPREAKKKSFDLSRNIERTLKDARKRTKNVHPCTQFYFIEKNTKNLFTRLV